MQPLQQFVQLNSEQTSLLIDCRFKEPTILYWGKLLSDKSSAVMFTELSTRQEAKCSVVTEAAISLSPSFGKGFTGAPGIEVFDEKSAWSLSGELTAIKQSGASNVVFESVDTIRNLKIIHYLELDYKSNVLTASTELINMGNDNVSINWCAAPTMPLPDNLTKIMSFEGRWSNEFQRNSIDLFLGSFIRENRKGKTSHDTFPAMIVHEQYTHEFAGDCYGFHLGWSGNHKMRTELLAEGRLYTQLGELLLPGEVNLSPNESYNSPNLYASYSSNGFGQLSQNYHQFVREKILSKSIQDKPRPVHYNTWEAIYFDHDVETLKQLADHASQLGVERFVLDDGWFKGRRGDFAGLGDWIVDSDIYPDGLDPIIDYVNNAQMEFGLWFEPEMVNPDSDLYRAHPDWVLSSEGNEQLTFRNQLVLDVTRGEVFTYLFTAINDILTEYPKITYIKWDMNRDLNHAGGHNGKPAVHKQTRAVYHLIAKIKAAHPHVEIESCSSGGGRADYGVLTHTDRIWTSDSNDALDRLSIQRGCSYFFPAEIMGAHVGPRDCHITGRRVSIEMRAAVAMFGHMGIEMDPRELTDHEKSTLMNAITLHKKYRNLIHSGQIFRLNDNSDSVDFGVVNEGKSLAIFSYNSVRETKLTTPPKFRFVGLNTNTIYQLALVWPTELNEYSTSVLNVVNGKKYSGEALMQLGLQLPIVNPQTSLIFELKAVN